MAPIKKSPTKGKVIPKKPKPAKKAAAKPKALPAPPAPVIPARAEIQYLPPAPGLTTKFVDAAKRLDSEICDTHDRIGRDMVSISIMLNRMRDEALFTALGYDSINQYFEARFPEKQRSTLYASMRTERELTGGDHPIMTHDDLREMTPQNASGVIKLAKAGVAITPEVIAEAKSMTGVRFEKEVVAAKVPEVAQRQNIAQGAIDPDGAETLVRRVLHFDGPVAAMEQKCFQITRLLATEDFEDRAKNAGSFENRAYSAIFAEFIGTYQAEYEERLKDQQAADLNRAQTFAQKMGTDAPLSQAAKEGTEGEEALEKVVTDTCTFISDDLRGFCDDPSVPGEAYCEKHLAEGNAIPG